ncbi:Cytochrome oxidase assembly [Candidatus Sulfopaludibacter sp. SbA4]|nr:Cytochrome oxidase assembly [Candidatus Sulfopaludibacter sp. SbA4]
MVAVSTLLLVIAGGLVTSNDAAQSVPDWPLSYGKLVPPLEGGIRFEFAHRVLAATVTILTLILALWSRSRLAWVAFAAVVAQALLGGAVVTLVAPKWMPVAHACLAQLVFGLIVAIVVRQYCARRKRVEMSLDPAGTSACATLFVQTILGAAVRHNVAGIVPHIVFAAVATLVVMWAGVQVLMHHMENPPFRRSAILLLSLTFSQVFLGMGAYMSRILTADDPQPMPIMISFTVAHVAVGSLAFGAAIAMAIIVGHGGMTVA